MQRRAWPQGENCLQNQRHLSAAGRFFVCYNNFHNQPQGNVSAKSCAPRGAAQRSEEKGGRMRRTRTRKRRYTGYREEL